MYEPDAQKKPVDYLTNLLEQSRMSSDSSPFLPQITGGDELVDNSTDSKYCSSARRREGIFSIKNNIESSSLFPKPETPKKAHIQELVRRKSCHCTCCGGLSKLESKILHFPQDNKRNPRKDKVTTPAANELDKSRRLIIPHYTSQSSGSLLGSKCSIISPL